MAIEWSLKNDGSQQVFGESLNLVHAINIDIQSEAMLTNNATEQYACLPLAISSHINISANELRLPKICIVSQHINTYINYSSFKAVYWNNITCTYNMQFTHAKDYETFSSLLIACNVKLYHGLNVLKSHPIMLLFFVILILIITIIVTVHFMSCDVIFFLLTVVT